MKRFQSLESFFMGAAGLGLVLFVGLSFAALADRPVEQGRSMVSDTACAPAPGPTVAAGSQAAVQAAGGEPAKAAASDAHRRCAS